MTIRLGTRYLGRYREILSVFTRHGFGWLLAELGLTSLLPLGQRLSRSEQSAPLVQAVHLRQAFEELGATFVKLGQVLSTRSDLLPPEYIAELAKLQDAVPPVSFEWIEAVIQAELGATLQELFLEFDPEPLAAASIGQVHAAFLPHGEEVVVKVQRPGVAEEIEQDLAILLDLARIITEHTSFGRDYDVLSLAQEFAFNLRCELNYVREAENAEHFRALFQDDPDICIPRIHWRYTGERVLVMERMRGLKITDVDALDRAGVDRCQLAANFVRLMLEEMFVHGFFHADPHPGNVYVLEDGRIGLIDFGMMGRLDEALQEGLSRLFLAVAKGDSERVMDEMLFLGMLQGQVNKPALKRDLDHMITCYAHRSAQEIAAANLFSEITALARRHRLRMPADLVLMARVMAISEGIGLQLNPDFQFIPFSQPYLERYWLHRHSPLQVGEKIVEGMVDMTEFGLSFPRRFTRLVTLLEQGELGGQIEIRDMGRTLDRVQRMVHQLSASVLVGALIVGLSQFMHMVAPEGFLQEYAGRFFGFLFVIAIVLGFWLLISIVRSR